MPVRQQVHSTSTARYHKFVKTTDDSFVDLQFQAPPPKIPFKAIALAAVLFIAGSSLIVVGSLLLAGYIDVKYNDRTWPVLILGTLMFIPGAYHVRIAYFAWQGYDGYSYDDIPEFE